MKNFIIISILLLMLLISCAHNRNYSEYSPSISADGNMLIYQANRDAPDKYKIFLKYKFAGIWGLPVHMITINSIDGVDGGPFITYDQNNLLLSSSRPGGLGNVDIWVAKRVGGIFFRIPDNIGAPINSPGYDGFASISPDGQTIYFVRECKDKIQYNDDIFCLYYADKKGDKWGNPKKMPLPINSRYSEFGPVILADNKTLIFSSARKGGLGGYDLYKSVKRKNRWSTPVNLGKEINTKDDDRLISIPASGDIMYCSIPVRDSKKNSLLRYEVVTKKLPEKLRQSTVITISGEVTDAEDEDKKLHSFITINDYKHSFKPIKIESNKHDGKYIVILNNGKIYDVSITAKGYTFYSKKIDLKNVKKYKEYIQDIKLEKLKVGAKIILHSMFFKSNSYKLLRDSKFELERLVRMLNENPSLKLEIGGHTAKMATEDFNIKLSRQRANSVRKYLLKLKISKDRLIIKGYGSSMPIGSNEKEETRKKNRRVEVKVIEI